MLNIDSILSKTGNIVSPAHFNTVEVDFGNGIVEGFPSNYVDAINSKIALRGSSISFDVSDMTLYLNLLLSLRIDQVQGRKVDFRVRGFLVPALYALSLNQIGNVYDREQGIQLTPTIKAIDKMSLEEASNFSKRLQLIQDLGFELVPGLPAERTGDINFMYFHYTDSMVLRHSSSAHPGYAVLAAFFRMQQLESLLSYRVSYGLIAEYDELLKGLIYDEARTR